MNYAGLALTNSHTGMAARILDADEEIGRGFTLEYSAPPGSPTALIQPHLHSGWTEEFQVVSGEARYRLGREERSLKAGEGAILPPGVPHLHPWNAGAEPLTVRQTTTFAEPDPEAIGDTIRAFAMLFWLANEGKVDAHGRPDPLQGALILRTLHRHGGYQASPPVPIQRLLVAVLARIAERRGKVAFDPRCMPTT